MPEHSDVILGEIHKPHNWEYANATARGAATGMVAGDVGKLARQVDDNTLWMLTDDSPVTWVQVGGGAGAGRAANPMTTAADMIVGGTAGAETKLAKGTDGQRLVMASGAQSWVNEDASINYIIDGGGSAITTGDKGSVRIDFACTIVSVALLADQSGSVVLDIWKDTQGNAPPTVADTITASAKPTLSSAQKAEDATLTGWTTAIAAGDWLTFNVDSAATITRLTVAIKIRRS